MDKRLFEVGLASGLLTVGASFLLRTFLGWPFLPELAASAVYSHIPGSIESVAVENLGPLAKEATYVTSSAVLVLVLALVVPGLRRFGLLPRSRGARFVAIVLCTYVLMVALGSLFLTVTEVSTVPVSLASIMLSMAVPSFVFVITLFAFRLSPRLPSKVSFPTERAKTRFDRKRRLFITATAGAAVGAVLLYYGVGALFSKQAPVPAGQEKSQILSSQVTSNDDFYRVDINVFAPSVDSSTWSLNLHGLVNTPMKFDYQTLKSLPSVQEYATLECVSNVIGGDLMSTALWKGVQLKTVLNMAGVNANADYVVFRCYDGYDVGIPLEKAMADGTILAYEMNSTPLPEDHGYPLRAIVPGLYGMMNAKWITDIELVSGSYGGFWQRAGWTAEATYQTGSTVVSPGGSALRDRFPIPLSLEDVSGSPIPLIGVAFAGDRGIQKVEVSTDGGDTWQNASLQDPLSKYTWVFWRLDWNPPATGDYRLMVRATDGTGQTQVATMTNPFPDGATGLSVVDFRVASP